MTHYQRITSNSEVMALNDYSAVTYPSWLILLPIAPVKDCLNIV